jgi:hypothetical protein
MNLVDKTTEQSVAPVEVATVQAETPTVSKIRAMDIFGLDTNPKETIAKEIEKRSEKANSQYDTIIDLDESTMKVFQPEKPTKVMTKDPETGKLVDKEEPKTEEVKSEEVKSEKPTTEEVKTEEVKTEEVKTEKVDDTKVEAKTEEVKTEEVKSEEVKEDGDGQVQEVSTGLQDLDENTLYTYADITGDYGQLTEEQQAKFFQWRTDKDKNILDSHLEKIVQEAQVLGQEITEEEWDTVLQGGSDAVDAVQRILGRNTGVAVTLAARNLIPQFTKQLSMISSLVQPLVQEKIAVEQAVASYEFFNSYPQLSGEMDLPNNQGKISFAQAAKQAAQELQSDPKLQVKTKKEYYDKVAKKTVENLAKYGIKITLQQAQQGVKQPAPVVQAPVQPVVQAPVPAPVVPTPVITTKQSPIRVNPPGTTSTVASIGSSRGGKRGIAASLL